MVSSGGSQRTLGARTDFDFNRRSGTEGGKHAQQKGDRQDEDAQCDGPEAKIDHEKCQGEQQRKERLQFVRLNRQPMVRSDQHLGERDEVK